MSGEWKDRNHFVSSHKKETTTKSPLINTPKKMEDDNIEGFTLDSSLIDDEDSPLIEEYLSNFNSPTIITSPYQSPKPKSLNNSSFHKQVSTTMTATTIPTNNTTITASNVNVPTSPKRVPSLRDKLQVLLDKANNEKKKVLPNNNNDEGPVEPTSPKEFSPLLKMVATPSEVKQLIAAKEKNQKVAASIEGEDVLQDESSDQTNDQTNKNNINVINENPQDTSAPKMAAKLPPNSKPELKRTELKKMDEHQQGHFEEYKNTEEESSHYEEHYMNETNNSILQRDEDEEFHNQLTADISLIEEVKGEQHNSFTVEEEKLDLSDDEEELKGRAMEDLTVSKLEASTASVDQSLTLSSLATPTRTTSPTRARPHSSMRSGTPSYMNSTRASSSKEVSRTSLDLRGKYLIRLCSN